MNRTLIFVLLIFAGISAAQDIPAPYRFNRDVITTPASPKPFTTGDAAYWGSVGWLGMGHFADHLSSRNRQELNPLLRGADGRYNEGRGVAVKLGMVTGLVVIQHYDVKRHPKHRKWWTVFNYSAGSVAYVIAAKNTRGGW